MENRICSLFGIRYPIVAGGMIWCSGWRLAAAVSEAGGLGLIGSGSMTPDLLREHIRRCREATRKPFGVNVPLMYRYADQIIETVIEERVPVVFTSAGNPKNRTAQLHEAGCKVAHVVSSSKFARKSEEAGVDAVVAEGFEAGGHNGREETPTMVLTPHVRRAVRIPLLAAGGIATGRGMLAAFALGAEGVQLGTRFALTRESSASEGVQEAVPLARRGRHDTGAEEARPDTPGAQRLLPGRGGGREPRRDGRRLSALLGRGRPKRGIFEGDLSEGELEIGQAASLLRDLPPAGGGRPADRPRIRRGAADARAARPALNAPDASNAPDTGRYPSFITSSMPISR